MLVRMPAHRLTDSAAVGHCQCCRVGNATASVGRHRPREIGRHGSRIFLLNASDRRAIHIVGTLMEGQ